MAMNKFKKAAYLLLQDGTLFEGTAIGKEGTTIGEVVFSTSMVGYQEALTDPSNYGTLLVQTFPLIGNYGINKYSNESDKTHLNGYIIREICDVPSNFRCEDTLQGFMEKNNVVGICDIDTRKLTRLIREKGVMNAMLTTTKIDDISKAIEEIKSFKIEKAIETTSCKKQTVYNAENGKYNVALLDLGTKKSLIEAFTMRDCNVAVLPYTTSSQEIIDMKPDAIVVSDGAGDPCENVDIIKTVNELIKANVPMFGIGLGHQIIALANKASVKKMHYGHRGANQPVVNLENSRTYITTQNHGYIVDDATIDNSICEVTFKNANDKTCEGLSYKDAPVYSVQFTPDATQSMLSTSYVYDKLIAMINK